MRRRKSRLVFKKRAAPGTPPGVLVADPSAAATTIAAIAYRPDVPGDGFREVKPVATGELPALAAEGGMLWVDLAGLADQAAIQAVAAQFGLHPLTVEDITNTHQRPKVEIADDSLFIVFRMLPPGGSIEGEQVSMVVGQGHLLTFQERPGDCFEPVRDRLRRGKGRIRAQGADYLAYALLDAAVDGYFPALETMGEEIEILEDEVVLAPTARHVERLHHLKRDLLLLRRAIWPLRELLNALLRDETALVSDATRPYLRDAYDHTVQLMDIVETYREIASGLLDVYLSSQSAKLNEVMKVLTIIATIFMPMSFVASVYGMNFDTSHPWNMPELGWPFGYLGALGLMAAIAATLLWWFRREGWLGDGRSRHRS
jgi:magnesium transporter